MAKNGMLPEHVKKMFYSCAADYKRVHTPFSYSGYYSSCSNKNLGKGEKSKILSLIY